MRLQIRAETPADYETTHEVVRLAFENAEHTDGKEHDLVAKLRRSEAFVPELSLVAEMDDRIVGHVLFTTIHIENDAGQEYRALALAPISVLPEFQGQKIGAALIREGHRRAQELGFLAVIVLGHADYYPRFGYERASGWSIRAPFDAPDECFMALELAPNALTNVSGVVKYPPEFGVG